MRILPILLLTLLLSTIAYAQEDAMQKYRNYTPQQIQNLPEEVRKGSVPMAYIFAAQGGLTEGAELFFGMELNQLMYPGIHDYEAAIKAFQADLGDKPTGVLTVGQIHQLEQRAGMQKLAEVLFPAQYFSLITDEHATVQGTIILIDEKIAYPINHVKVKCFKREQYCQHDQTQIIVPDEKSWGQNYQVLTNDTEYYNITRWDADSIDAVHDENKNSCRTTSMNFNFKSKEFHYITRNSGRECEFLGAKLPELEKPRIAQVIDGENIIQAEFQRVKKSAYDALASDFKKRVEEILADIVNKKGKQ